jgi:hypothetical protein
MGRITASFTCLLGVMLLGFLFTVISDKLMLSESARKAVRWMNLSQSRETQQALAAKVIQHAVRAATPHSGGYAQAAGAHSVVCGPAGCQQHRQRGDLSHDFQQAQRAGVQLQIEWRKHEELAKLSACVKELAEQMARMEAHFGVNKGAGFHAAAATQYQVQQAQQQQQQQQQAQQQQQQQQQPMAGAGS